MTSHAADLSRAVWQKSTYSGGNGGQCIEIATNLPGVVAVRDSKNPDGAKLLLSPAQWQAFLLGMKVGTID
jgi:Domain of unknown function (DUF397)